MNIEKRYKPDEEEKRATLLVKADGDLWEVKRLFYAIEKHLQQVEDEKFKVAQEKGYKTLDQVRFSGHGY